METVAIDTQWIETFKLISKEEINSPTRITKNEIYLRETLTGKKYGVTVDDDKENVKMLSIIREQFLVQRKMRMMRMQPLFASQPRLEKICKNWGNDFVDSSFTTYIFPRPATKSFKSQEDDLKYLINLCGCNLTKLDLYYYPFSQIMQLIKYNCLNLKKLVLRFEEIESKDFYNVFSNMSHLEGLSIYWQCENSTLPMTLIESLEHVRETLKNFVISCESGELSDLEDTPVESIYNSSVLSPETEALMTVISSMKNLKSAIITLDYDLMDKFFINLTINSRNLKSLIIRSSKITDKGLIALNNLQNLRVFSLGLMGTNIENKFITDRSVQCLFNSKIQSLDLSNCIQVTNSAIIELDKNLPNLQFLNIDNTKATIEVFEEINRRTQFNRICVF